MDQQMPSQAPQPMRQPETVHRHNAAPIVAALLGLLLVLETGVLEYGIMQYSKTKNELATVQAALDLASQPEEGGGGADSEEFEIPLLYVKKGDYPNPYGNTIVKIDRESGEETVLRELEPGQYATIVAIPQRDYGGEVFLHMTGEGDNPYFNLYKMYYSGSRPEKVNFFDGAGGYVFTSAVAVSPDQTRIAYIPFDMEAANPSSKIIIYNLLTGESETIARLSDMSAPDVTVGYSFALVDDNALGGMSGMEFAWKDNSCVNAGVYSFDENPKISFQTFCEE